MKQFLSLFCFLFAALAAPNVGAQSAMPVSAVSREPYFADILRRAEALKAKSEDFAAQNDLAFLHSPAFKAYQAELSELSALTLKGHEILKARGTDSDLKCILMGLHRDMKRRAETTPPADQAAMRAYFTDIGLLMRDTIEVIETPATTDSGLDCTIEFGETIRSPSQ